MILSKGWFDMIKVLCWSYSKRVHACTHTHTHTHTVSNPPKHHNLAGLEKWPSFTNTLVALVVKNPPAKAGDTRDTGSIPGSGRSPGEGHGNPLQHSCLEDPMDWGAWWAIVHRVTKSQTQLKWLSTHSTQWRKVHQFELTARQLSCMFERCD